MSQLVSYFEDRPLDVDAQVEIHQAPISSSRGLRSTDGIVRPRLVYVVVPSEPGPFLVPFGAYDDWSLRDRYNEAIRIMNTLGASSITCESFREVKAQKRFFGRVAGQGGEISLERAANSGFDFRHTGAGSAARDPRPLRWPDEPGFSAAVSSVLVNRATEVEINIRIERTHSTDGTLGLTLQEIGFDLGGSFGNSGVTTLHILAVFPSGGRGWK